MPRTQYQTGTIRANGMVMLRQVNKVIEAYEAMGYKLTLRQVYYQMVARDIIPNNMKSYNSLGELINKGRLLGLIDWNAIEDRTRYLRALSHWDEPGDIISSAVNSYRIDLWKDQPQYCEVWVEKDALIGIIEGVAERNDVPCFSCRGYTSQTAMWDAAQRLIEKSYNGERPVIVIHLGDHDPSGVDMTRDIEDRIRMFCTQGDDGPHNVDFKINRIALNMDQVEAYKPPPNPAKMTDARFASYVKRFGKTCWELDAIEPQELDLIISKTIGNIIDSKKMRAARERQDAERKQLEHAEEFVRQPDRWNRIGKMRHYFGA